MAAGTGTVERSPLPLRRAIFATLVGVTMLAALAAMTLILTSDGTSFVDIAMIVLFGCTLPWTVIGFWNALIGLALILRHGDRAAAVVTPCLDTLDTAAPIAGHTAIVLPIHNEDTALIARQLRAMLASLEATGDAEHFDLFILSDTTDAQIVAAEAEMFAALRRDATRPFRIHYRRRQDNAGQKTGNLWDFLDYHGDDYDYMLVLDADSLMSGAAITRLARLMDANPKVGLLQTLVVGLPAESAFARTFQFGMRHGMRTYTLGSAWWQGDAGPYWGHNAIVRVDAFRAHCKLPELPGRKPFGGQILSHDQVEAARLRAAGYEVRVLADEYGSYEHNPPSLIDYAKRDLRWCQGNMQYVGLLRRPGFRPMGRVQLLLAILMYVSSPCWMAFLMFAFGGAVYAGLSSGGDVAGNNPWAIEIGGSAIVFMIAILTMTFAPKLAGVFDVLSSARRRRRYGGGFRVVAGALLELLFSFLMSPVMALAHTIFIVGMLFGRTISWDAQTRGAWSVPLGAASKALWPQMLAGVVLTAVLAVSVPALLPWAAPILVGLLLAAPFTAFTSSRIFGRAMTAIGLCATPEEISPGIEPTLFHADGRLLDIGDRTSRAASDVALLDEGAGDLRVTGIPASDVVHSDAPSVEAA